MNTALVGLSSKALQEKFQAHDQELKTLPKPLQAAIRCLISTSDSEVKHAMDLIEQSQQLHQRKLFLKTFTDIPDDASFVLGKPYDWPQFWLERLNNVPQVNLAYLPYKQCCWCGLGIIRPYAKNFCTVEHFQRFRIWRNNVIRVGKKKNEVDRESYYLEKVCELYTKNQPPRLQSVLEAAYRLAVLRVSELTSSYAKGKGFNGPDFVLLRAHNIIPKMLKHYQQRRFLTTNNIGVFDLAIQKEDLSRLMTPASFMTEEYLYINPKQKAPTRPKKTRTGYRRT